MINLNRYHYIFLSVSLPLAEDPLISPVRALAEHHSLLLEDPQDCSTSIAHILPDL